jgi:hypothetical protein
VEWIILVRAVRAAFLIIYAIFVVSSLVKWIRTTEASKLTLRDRLGSLGMAAGICSAALFAWFHVYVWVAHELIAHGAGLWLYYYAGGCAAVVGLIFGLAGRGWVRQSATIIALVMAFQWFGEMVVGLRKEAFITLAMFVFLAAGGVISLAGRYFIGKCQRE